MYVFVCKNLLDVLFKFNIILLYNLKLLVFCKFIIFSSEDGGGGKGDKYLFYDLEIIIVF